MKRQSRDQVRHGTILVMVALCTVMMFGLLALAIDLGMVAVARSQCQNAADAAATAGARTINGDSSANYNFDQVPKNAIKAAIANKVLGTAVTGSATSYTTTSGYIFNTGNVKIEAGAYTYKYNDANPSSEGFQIQFPRLDSTEPYTAVRATVSGGGNYAFGRVFGASTFNANATAISAHRPRDVIIILDLSGSMRFQSLPGMNLNGSTANPSSTSRPRTVSLNNESIFPQFGHYSATSSAGLRGNSGYSTGTEYVDLANISTSSNSGPAILEDFYQNATGVLQSSANRAFARAADTYATAPAGNNYPYTNNNNTTTKVYAKTAQDIFEDSGGTYQSSRAFAWENFGSDSFTTIGTGPANSTAAFSYSTSVDYTQGPGYWGKTFFMWPPDPRAATSPAVNSTAYNNNAPDWRRRFFIQSISASTPACDNTTFLFNPSGAPADNTTPEPTPVVNTPDGAGYRINYEAILQWIRNEDPKPFPTILRAGKIKYYDDIPDPSATKYAGLNNRWWTTSPENLTDLNERFWRGYIDFVLGLQAIGAGVYTNTNVNPDGDALSNVPLSALIGNGDYYAWGTVQVSGKPSNPSIQTTPRVVSGNTINSNATGSANGAHAVNATTISVTGMPTTNSTGVSNLNNKWIRFSGHRNVYKITSVSSSGSNQNVVINSFTVTNGRPSGTYLGLLSAVASGENFTVFSSMPRYMDYDDNPYRPKHQYWFGPMTLIDYLGNYNTTRFWWPGNVHEAQAWACKVGIQTAIDDIKKNHPNDFIGMTFFSSPYEWKNSNKTSKSAGQHNRAVVPLGRNYDQLMASLWFPPTTVTGTATEITPYDADFDNVPRAKGGTSPMMGFMITYNLLSSSTTNLRFHTQPQPDYRGGAGGLGRKGANRLVIFETDGAPNNRAYAALAGSGGDSYYPIRVKYPETITNSNNEFPIDGTYLDSEVYAVVDQIRALTTASPPGYATNRKPVYVYPLGYGSLFDPGNTSSGQSDALDFMQNVAYRGGTASTTTGTDFPNWQRIYGTNTQRIDRMQAAFTKIMQNGVQITLLE